MSTQSTPAQRTMSIQQPIFLSADAIAGFLTWPNVIGALRDAYAANLSPHQAPPRVVARGNGAWLRALAAVSPTGRTMGAKLFGLSRSKGVNYVVVLFDQESGRILAFVDGKDLTASRTAGTSAIAVDSIAPNKELSVALLGSGSEAEAHARALATVRRFSSLKIYSPTAANRESLAARLRGELHVDASAAGSAQEAVEGADLVIAAARSKNETPILMGKWLRAGATVVSIGSTLPEQREVDSEVIARSALIVADVPEEVEEETGDMIDASAQGVLFTHKLIALSDIVSGKRQPRAAADEIVTFKSVGSALQDIAVAEMCLFRALGANAGTPLPIEFSLKQV